MFRVVRIAFPSIELVVCVTVDQRTCRSREACTQGCFICVQLDLGLCVRPGSDVRRCVCYPLLWKRPNFTVTTAAVGLYSRHQNQLTGSGNHMVVSRRSPCMFCNVGQLALVVWTLQAVSCRWGQARDCSRCFRGAAKIWLCRAALQCLVCMSSIPLGCI